MSRHMESRINKASANWIWFQTEESTNVFARARHTCLFEQSPNHAEMRITCSGQYCMWINGSFVGRGPAHSAPQKKRYDFFDISHHLREGENVIGVRLIHFGYRTAHSPESSPGFWCQLDYGDDSAIADEDWRFSIDQTERRRIHAEKDPQKSARNDRCGKLMYL